MEWSERGKEFKWVPPLDTRKCLSFLPGDVHLSTITQLENIMPNLNRGFGEQYPK